MGDGRDSLVDLVRQDSAGTPYPAKECIHSGRMILEVLSGKYCGLSERCPLQGERDGGYLYRCRRDDYYRELAQRKVILDRR